MTKLINCGGSAFLALVNYQDGMKLNFRKSVVANRNVTVLKEYPILS